MGDAPAITDDGIARLRARIGVTTPHPMAPHYLRPNEDAFRHVAESYGDDNPLWCDPAYAAASRWEGPLAPPHLVGGDTMIGENEVARLDDETKALLKGDPLRGVHAFYAGSFREWWHPLRPGTRVWRRNALVGVHDKRSSFAARAVHEWTGEVFAADGGPVLAAQYRLMIRTERSKATAAGKYDDIELRPYTDDELAAIDEVYAGERDRRRGAEPRWFEDVAVGDELGPIVKGPLRVTDMVCWHVGVGMGLYGVKALRLGYDQRQRVPRFFRPDDLNVPDVQQRVHWDPEWARAAGNPAIYDYGRMRETWLIHACTDWMGDDAWLWKLDCEFRQFNYVGDTHWVRGTVTDVYLAEGDRPAVDVELAAVNQRGVTTTPGHATILLPSREHGPVRLPDPPGGATTCAEALDALVERFAAMEDDVQDPAVEDADA
ncbi:MAG: MaoC family dehydratase N-terminal domain-containing protein [Acidimicrobiales bacterium]|nr:MaoC family dehydratase N-terminal domain-containing protein [Acidimicrobiales bacterium]